MSGSYIGASEENVEQAVLVQSDTEEFEAELLTLLGTGDSLASEWEGESSTSFQTLWQTIRSNLVLAISELREFNGLTVESIQDQLDGDAENATAFNLDPEPMH